MGTLRTISKLWCCFSVLYQVMVAMELCTNGALREALKLNISWPLKVILLSPEP